MTKLQKILLLILLTVSIVSTIIYYKTLTCKDKTITFDKVITHSLIKEGLTLLKSGNYIIKSDIEYSKYMPSKLKNILTKDEADTILISLLNPYVSNKRNNARKLIIDYYIYENDKNDTNKKGKKSKLYAGYLMFEFKIGKKVIYKIQTDYMTNTKKDIKERMKCALQSLISI